MMEKITMKQMVRDFFIPHEGNNMSPALFAPWATTFIAVTATLLIVFPLSIRQHQLASLASPIQFTPGEVIRLVNASRTAAGLLPLSENPILDAIADAKARDMATKSYFAHISPSGKTPWDFLREGGYIYKAAGENLAIDFPDAYDTHQALMNSPTHRANILGTQYIDIGVAIEQGAYEGHDSIFVAQYFGAPKINPVGSPEPARTENRAMSVPTTQNTTNVPTPKPTAKPQPITVATIQPTSTSPGANSEQASIKEMNVLGATATQQPVVAHATADSAPVGATIFIRIFAYLMIAVLLIGLLFAITRRAAIGMPGFARAALALILFGYLALYGSSGAISASKITPSSFSTIVIEQTK